MEIKGKMAADLVAYTIRRNKSHDGKTAHLDLDVGVSEQDAAKRFGDAFRTLAFATMHVEETEDGEHTYSFLQDAIKPGKRVVCERHVISIGEHEVSAQPTVLAIRPVDGANRVTVRLRIPLDPKQGEKIGITSMAWKETVPIEFSPQQAQFAFVEQDDSAQVAPH